MDPRIEEIKIIDLLFAKPRVPVSGDQLKNVRAGISNNQRAALKEIFCRQRSVEEAAKILESSPKEITQLVATGLAQLKQRQKNIREDLSKKVIFLRTRKKSSPCGICGHDLSSRSLERDCINCFQDDFLDPEFPLPGLQTEGEKDA